MPEVNPQGYANQASPYQQAWDQFGAMMPPDPNTFLQLIWPYLDINTRHLVQRLLTNPAATTGQPMATAATQAQPAQQQAAVAQTAAPQTTAATGGQEGSRVQAGPGGFTDEGARPQTRAVQFGGRTVNIDSLAPKGSPANPEGQTNGTQRIFMKDGTQQVADLATGNGVPTPTRIGSQNAQFEVDMGGGVMAYARDAEGLRRLRAASGRQ